jgi:hypothetical protein
MAQGIEGGALFSGGGTGAGGFLGVGTVDRGTIDGAGVTVGDN